MKDIQPSPSSKRETSRYYIPMSESEERKMLSAVGVESLDDLYSHIPPEIRFDESHCAFPEMSSEQIRKEISSIASKNKAYTSDFLGDALPNWKLEKIVEKV